MHLAGEGVPADEARALAWLWLASLRGDDEAETARHALITASTTDLVPAAEALAPALPDPVLRIFLELQTLPVGLAVTHVPDTVRARSGGPSGYRYSWVHRTTVAALDAPVLVREFGAFYRSRGRWVFGNHTGEPFTTEHFAEWYDCPGSEVRPDAACTDEANWWGADELIGNTARWYYIGTRPDGRRVKGEAILRTLPEATE